MKHKRNAFSALMAFIAISYLFCLAIVIPSACDAVTGGGPDTGSGTPVDTGGFHQYPDSIAVDSLLRDSL